MYIVKSYLGLWGAASTLAATMFLGECCVEVHTERFSVVSKVVLEAIHRWSQMLSNKTLGPRCQLTPGRRVIVKLLHAFDLCLGCFHLLDRFALGQIIEFFIQVGFLGRWL